MATNLVARELRAAAGIGISFRQQAWLLGVSGRWVYLVLGLLAVLLLLGQSDVPREIPRISSRRWSRSRSARSGR